ncbi:MULTISPECIES: Tol-Pal system beta propeller repeat protein TolB [Rhodanobacter]|nr:MULTISPECIES: Tol-Pal system beta propeller repeat protein TolB [Rhodanobacter]EIM04860.1 translocation protein TolB [Rhodanobacter denitrificans]KZC21698.1 translocation protein TolB [Rhodanobacter denitrificans]UJJ51789.1 Tol-Pal system beta propeller repeat protein TolB [Rhodanobacter denitrificans]UJJ59436.1 Tol-Pal system beta propeller repeat protein TolB [Rhodanobacter denitrificans]UJM87045.1 Tol-Pal system beta propeller repeat protein TolB [Rhodanobacter denitrificans]
MRKFSPSFAAILLAVVALFAGPAAAQSLNVDIVGGVKTATPIVVVPFAQAGGAPLSTDVADVMRNDFNRSGKFRSLAKSDIVEFPSRGQDIKFPTWRLLKQDYIVVGNITDAGNGMVQVEYELWDVNKQQSLLHQQMPPTPLGDLRGVAHQIADIIYQKITGVRGAFWTRIAYITAVGLGNHTTYSLIVADSDGYNPQVVARSKESLLTPAWSPDGRKLAYVSFESGNSSIYVQDITTGSRQLVESHPRGINGAPAWSPDGSKLAVALSYVGNLELFVLDVASRRETRLTNSLSIDTEPVWAPDGQSIYFTSDRSGRPQIYQVPASGGTPQRISFQGQSNLNADVSYDGKQIAMVQGNGNVYRIAIMDRSLGDQVRFLSPGPIDESPSFAPNASMLLYAATEGRRGVLYAVSADGLVRQRLVLSDGDVREPAWGPYRQR